MRNVKAVYAWDTGLMCSIVIKPKLHVSCSKCSPMTVNFSAITIIQYKKQAKVVIVFLFNQCLLIIILEIIHLPYFNNY